MSLALAQLIDALVAKISRLERLADAHQAELQSLRTAVQQHAHHHNAVKFLQRQVTAGREQLDVLEQSVANLRASRRFKGS